MLDRTVLCGFPRGQQHGTLIERQPQAAKLELEDLACFGKEVFLPVLRMECFYYAATLSKRYVAGGGGGGQAVDPGHGIHGS
jgi:hypothetical protein